MEPVLFYGVPHGCSFGSIVALEWLGRPYRLCRIEMPLETGERTYVRLNPARQTPTLLLEDGRALSESLAILQHLAARDLCRKLGYPQGSAEFDELNFALALLHTECHSAWGGPVLSAGRRRNHDGKGAGARGASLWPDRQAARRPQVAGRRRAERGRRLPRGYRSLGTGAGLLRPATRLSAPASTPGEAGAGPGGALRPCHRGSPAGAELRGVQGRGDTGRSGEPPARLKSASAGSVAVTCPWLRAGAPPARPRPATARRPGSGLRRWRLARPGVRPG